MLGMVKTPYPVDRERILELLRKKKRASIVELRGLLKRNGEALNRILEKMKKEKLVIERKEINMTTFFPCRYFSLLPR